MELKAPLIEVLQENKKKIIDGKKYNDVEFTKFLNSLSEAEKLRQIILETIKKMGRVDVKKIKEKVTIPEDKIILNVEYLKELGLLKPFGVISEFYESIDKKNKREGLFPDVSVIQERNVCCGCGLCFSICPVNAINISTDILKIDKDICIDCGLCYVSCPRSFFPKELEKYEINSLDASFSKELGYFKNIYTSQTTDDSIKNVAQNGGIVTSLLKTAFRQKIIDGALVVGISKKPLESLPMIIQNDKELLKSAGTKYSIAYPLRILHTFNKFKKIAIVGTCCTMQALKKISIYPLNKPFYDNIVLKLGLFCMECFSYENLLNILKNEFNKAPENIVKMNVLKGRFYIIDNNKDSFDIPIKNVTKYGRFGCFFCDDLVNRLSDISIGSIGSESSWSTVITRSINGMDIFQKHQVRTKLIAK